MGYIDAFKANDGLIKRIGEGNAHLAWVMALYLEEPNIEALASEGITDGPNDKKIDFIYLDKDAKRIIFAQGYYTGSNRDSAPDSKASDLNTAAAWLISGDLNNVPASLKEIISDCRLAIADNEIELIELLYVHNMPESINVARELQTAAQHLQRLLTDTIIQVGARELGHSKVESLFATQESHIEVKDVVVLPAPVMFTEEGPKWQASITSVPGDWLHELYGKYQDSLFSANYRGFLGISRRRRINTGIRQSAETKPKDFWVFNNGITLLTLGCSPKEKNVHLTGISIINGAQTTGSLGSIDGIRHKLRDVKVLCRVIQCSDPETIDEIVKYNNTQNEITTWDQYSNDQEQNRLSKEFSDLGHTYIRKRGFRPSTEQIGIEDVAQPLLSFHGRHQDANRGKNEIFDRKPLYVNAFENKKARHILLVYTLSRAIDERRLSLKQKSSEGTIISFEESQLLLLRNLRFKAFFMAVVGQVLEGIIMKKVDPLTVAFTPQAANASKNSIIELVAMWGPIVDKLLAVVSTQIDTTKLSERFSDENFLSSTSKNVQALIYSSRAQSEYEAFSEMVTVS